MPSTPSIMTPMNTASASLKHKLTILKAMAVSLPMRQSVDWKTIEAGYLTALDGATRYGLDMAHKACMQGRHGHGFMPSPPELRAQHDKAMAPLYEAAAREMRAKRIEAERTPQPPPLTTEQRQRHDQRMAEFGDEIANAAKPCYPAEAVEAYSAITKQLIEAGKHKPAADDADINPPDLVAGEPVSMTKAWHAWEAEKARRRQIDAKHRAENHCAEEGS